MSAIPSNLVTTYRVAFGTREMLEAYAIVYPKRFRGWERHWDANYYFSATLPEKYTDLSGPALNIASRLAPDRKPSLRIPKPMREAMAKDVIHISVNANTGTERGVA